jgi:hypothetical protein
MSDVELNFADLFGDTENNYIGADYGKHTAHFFYKFEIGDAVEIVGGGNYRERSRPFRVYEIQVDKSSLSNEWHVSYLNPITGQWIPESKLKKVEHD